MKTSFLQRYARLLIILVVVLGIGAGAFISGLRNERDKTYDVHAACSVLTPQIARSVGGPGLQRTQPKNITNSNNVTSFCVYRSATTSLSLIVRSAKNKQGAYLNQRAFSSPPVAYQKTTGYGDDSYWTPTLGQFHILKNNTWYIMSNGSNTPSKRTLKDAKTLADAIIRDL